MIAILDYGSGNLRSAQKAFATSGHEVVITADRKVALEAEGLVVPGVGSFQSCMKGLVSIDGDSIIRQRLGLERPTLGICIGMQILFENGVEPTRADASPSHGVGIWSGSVSKMLAPILPHMGWNTVEVNERSTLFRGIADQSFYFVHSYAATRSVGKLQAWSEYGQRFLAAVEDGPITATQFHPEKSGSAGLRLIKNWTDSL
ncbi:MAG: imidazole glycerol phosphate synthase subunit HisH [Actinomycetes bacterium]